MAARIRSFPWEGTSLGPLSQWPPELSTVVNMALAMRDPVQLLWGEEMVLLYNDAFAPMYVDREPEALGQPGAVFWKDVWHLVREELEGVFRTGVATEHTEVLLPVLREGRVQDIWWDYSYTPVFNGEGRVAGILNIARDVTAKRNARLELMQSHAALLTERQRLMAVWQQAPVIFALLSGPEHRFVLTNPAYDRLVAHRDVLGRTVAEALPEVIEQGYIALLDEVLRTGQTYEGRGAVFKISPGEGQPPEDRILDFNYQPLREVDGTVTGIILIGIDITDNKRAERALVQNEKLAAVGRLAASIAHEINNPLEAVTNLLYLARHTDDSAEANGFLDTADGELRRVSAIASQTLRFHKQATRAEAATAEVLVGSVLRLYAGRMMNSRVALEERLRSSGAVVCFEGEVRQVLANLVSNAVDALGGDGGGRLLVRSRDCADGGMMLTVADDGPGMAPATLQRIFEPFYTTKGIGGTGLGLWISRQIVQRHGGRLDVRSRPGAGTVFRLYLPAVALDGAPDATVDALAALT